MREESVLDFIKNALMAEIHLVPFEIKFPPSGASQRKLSSFDSKLTLEGYLDDGQTTLFSVKGKDIVMTDETWTFGSLEVGNFVRVKGVYSEDEQVICISILTTPPPTP